MSKIFLSSYPHTRTKVRPTWRFHAQKKCFPSHKRERGRREDNTTLLIRRKAPTGGRRKERGRKEGGDAKKWRGVIFAHSTKRVGERESTGREEEFHHPPPHTCTHACTHAGDQGGGKGDAPLIVIEFFPSCERGKQERER